MQQVSGTGGAVGEVAVGSLLVGRYRLEQRIGAGGMATIYRSRDTSLERDVAVKVLHPHLADEPSVLARFRTEARHAAALVHPHIVHVYDQGDESLPFIVMELVDGPSLRQVLAERGRLTPREALALVEPVCRALTRAHAAGVVHRDIKPENVLVTTDGVAKVADFGIARALAETNHTQTGTLIGSVHYLAPELVNGNTASPASDQYAVGVLLYELLTGRKALPAESPMAVAIRHSREPIPVPSVHADDIAVELDEVVARATALDPRDRYDDMDAFVAALHAAVPDGPVPVVVARHDARGGERTLVIPPPVEDDSPTFPSVGTARRKDEIRLPDGPDEPPAPGQPDDPDEVDEAMPTRRRRRWLLWLSVILLVLLLAAGAAAATWHFAIAPIQQVPSLDGASEEQARTTLAELGLELEVTGTRDDRSVPEGAVLEQDPPPGTELRSGETVTVVVSAGPAVVTMPDVLQLPLDEARAVLEGEPYFFTIAQVDESHHDVIPAGIVIGQAPNAEIELRQDADVLLHVSLGIEQVVVPDLDGLDREAAEAALTEAQLTFDVAEEYSDDVPTSGQVISQSLEAGAEVDKGTNVAIIVSRGALTIAVPNVRGKPIDAAVAELRALDLSPRVITQPIPRVGPFRRGEAGLVEEQSPPPGQEGGIRRGESIDLYTFVDDEDGGDEDDD